MKRAKRLEICARSFERKIGTDHLDDVVRRRDLFDGFCWDCSYVTLDFSLVCFEKRCQTYAVRGRFPNVTKKIPIFVLICCLGVETAQARDVIHKGDIIVVPLRGEISPSLLMFLRRTEKAAESSGALATIFEMDTYGGRLDSAAEITNVLNRATIPTYTFINSNAGSAGSLIALATQHIYMAPVSAIGAAAPVLPTGEDLPLTEREKTISYFSALIRSSAKKNGHNEDIGEAFMNKDKEVKIGDRVIHPKGTILTLNAQEAAERIGGKPLLADGIADSVVDVMLILASLLWAMIDRYPGETFFPRPAMLAVPLRNLFLALVGAAIVIWLLARYLPRTSIYRRFALMITNPPGPSLAGAPRQFATALALAPGMQGTAVTVLRPSGKARFADHVVDVVTEGEFIAPKHP